MSSRPARLTAAAQAATALLHPLRWSQVYPSLTITVLTMAVLTMARLTMAVLTMAVLWSQVYVPLVPRSHLSVAGAPFPYIQPWP